MRSPGMVLTAEAVLLAEFTGGPDKLAEIAAAVEALRVAEAEAPPGADRARCPSGEAASEKVEEPLAPETQVALDAYRASLVADGWT